MQLIAKIDRALAKLEEVLLALLLVGMVVLAAVQVLLRNIWSTAIDWADISLQNVTVIIGLLGAAVATSEGRHLNIDLLSRWLTARRKVALRVVIGLFGVGVCAYLAKGGWTTFRANYEPWLRNVPEGWTSLQLLRQEISEGTFPQWLSQVPLAGGFALIALHFLLRLLRDADSLVSGKDWQAAEEAGPQGDAMLDALEARAAAGEAPPDRSASSERPAGDSGRGERNEEKR